MSMYLATFFPYTYLSYPPYLFLITQIPKVACFTRIWRYLPQSCGRAMLEFGCWAIGQENIQKPHLARSYQ